MAVWSSVNIGQLPNFRFDAEYYQPSYVELSAQLAKADPQAIGDFAYVTDGIHASPEWVEEGGMRYLSAKSVKDNEIILHTAGQISLEQHRANPRTEARINDVLLTTVGTIGNAAVVDEDVLPANMDRHLGIIRIHNPEQVDPYYLATFLNSKYGMFQSVRESTGNVQLNLFIDKIKKIQVPVGGQFNQIGELTRQAYDLRRQSRMKYLEADSTFLHELGVHNLELPEAKSFTAMFSQAAIDARLDSEHFQPKYYMVLDILQSLGPERVVPLGELLSLITNGHTPYHHDLSEGEVVFLTAEHISDFKINLVSVKRILAEDHLKLLARTRLSVGDILVTIKGKIGNAAVVEYLNSETNINQDVALLRLRTQYHLYYVVGFLNSIAGKLLIEQASTGQINPFLRLGSLEQIPIPLFSTDLMDRIGERVQETVLAAAALEDAASQLLAKAKHVLESEISNRML